MERINEVEENPEAGQWQYGIIFKASPRKIMEAVIAALGELDTVSAYFP